MEALRQVALLAGGCQQSCALPVVGRPNAIAYCSSAAVYMHTPTTVTPNATTVQDSDNKTFCAYPLTQVFANGVVGPILSFDFNEEYVACVTSSAKTAVWRLADAELLNDKRLPSGVSDIFGRVGGPSAVRVAGKHHILYGTKTGWLVSANMNDGKTVHSLQLGLSEKANMATTIPTNATTAATSSGNSNSNKIADIGQVTVIDVSPLRPDTIAVGTSEGALVVVTLHPVNGMRQNILLRPFGVPTIASDRSGVNGTNQSNGNGNVNSTEWLPVTNVAFDPNNASCVAVGSRDGALVLVDIVSSTITQTFEVQDTPVTSISWLNGQAGMFVTTDGESPKLRVWSVNNRTPALIWNPVAGSALFGSTAFAIGKLFLALRDGSVAVFNTKRQQIEMRTEAGHTDTIHRCRYAHHNRDLLASASTDGTIRVWNTMQLALQHTIDLGRVVVCSVDWSLSGKYLVAALGSGEVVCYHVNTQRENWRTIITSNGGVCCVSWSVSESSNLIAASHNGGVAVLSSRDGKVVRRYSTKSPVLGVDFDPKHAKQFAAACQDGQVLVFHPGSSREEPILTLTGHSGAVSNVLYNPTVPNFLLSCSHDNTLRLWDVSSAASHTASVSARVLRGHTNCVTALAWCSLAPYFALSGSLDCTVRLWDVRSEVNVAVIRAHGAGVLALSGHPERPLVFASVSLDSTILFWHLGLLRQVYLNAALGTLEHCIVSDSDALMTSSSENSTTFVSGNAVQQLNQDLSNPNLSPHKRMERLVGFFEFPHGAADVARAAGFCSDPQDLSNAKCTVVPASMLVEVRGKLVKSNVEKVHGKAVTSAGEKYKKTRLIAAAEEMLLIGKVNKYCQLMVEAGEWDSAIAVAPLVGRDFWRSLCLQTAETMEAAGDVRAVRYFIMAEECTRAARLVARQSDKNWDLAAVIAQTCPQRVEQATTEPPHNTTVDTNGVSAVVSELLGCRATALAHAENPRIVAAAKLVEGANDDAVMHLVHGGDVVMAHLLIHAVPLHRQATIDAGYRLSMLQSCCQQDWNAALICATRQSNPYDGLATVLAHFQHAHNKTSAGNAGSATTAMNDALKSFHGQVLAECQRLQLPLDAERIQQQHANDGLASMNQFAAMVLSPNTPIGAVTSEEVLQTMSSFIDNILQIVLQDIDGLNTGFYLKQAFAVTHYVSLPIKLQPKNATPTGQPISAGDVVGDATHTATMRKLLAQSFLLAALMCVKVYRFPKLLNFAFTRARDLGGADFSLAALLSKVQPLLGSYSPHGVDVECAPPGLPLPARGVADGAQLRSALTAEPIGGAVHRLEDGASCVGGAEMQQWMLCCAFSPLATGAKLLPL